jgi:alanine racemase
VGPSARLLTLSSALADQLARAISGDPVAAEDFDSAASEGTVRLTAEVLHVKRVAAGAGVSYGHTYRTPRETTLALIAIGYGHGIPRKAGNRAAVTWRDPASGATRRLAVAGRVAMDVLVVDAGDAAVRVGDTVVLFGDPRAGEIPLAEWASAIGEVPTTVVACLDSRVEREVGA